MTGDTWYTVKYKRVNELRDNKQLVIGENTNEAQQRNTKISPRFGRVHEAVVVASSRR